MKLWALLIIVVFVGSVTVQGKYYEIDDVDFYPYPVAAGADFYKTFADFKRRGHDVDVLKPLNDSLTTYKQQLASCILFQTSSPIINLGWSKIILRMCSEGYINAKKSLEAIDQCAAKPKDLRRTEITRKAEFKDTTFKKEWTIELFCGVNNKAIEALPFRVGKTMTKLLWGAPRKVYHYSKHKKYYDLHTEFRKHFDQKYHPNVTGSNFDRPTIRHTDGGVAVIQARYKNYSDFSSISSCQNDCVRPQFYPLPIFVGNPNHGGVRSFNLESRTSFERGMVYAQLAYAYIYTVLLPIPSLVVASSVMLVSGGFKLADTINKRIKMKKEIQGLYTLDKNDVKMANNTIQLLCNELPNQSRPPICHKDVISSSTAVDLQDLSQFIEPTGYDGLNKSE